jgi:hypothetical protein
MNSIVRRNVGLVALGIVCLTFEVPLVSQGDEFKCRYSRKVECSASGCQETPVGTAYLLLPKIDSPGRSGGCRRRISKQQSIR